MCDSSSVGQHDPGGQRMAHGPHHPAEEADEPVSLGLGKGPVRILRERLGRGNRTKSFPSSVQEKNNLTTRTGREIVDHLLKCLLVFCCKVAGVQRPFPCRKKSDKGQGQLREDQRGCCWEVHSVYLWTDHCSEKAL